MAESKLYTLNIHNIWDPVEDKNFWESIIEVSDNLSLFALHLFIQDIINFDNDHLFEFYAGRNDRNRKIVFSDNPGYPDGGGDYENVFLNNIYPLKGLKLYYLFDLGDQWVFEIRRNRKIVKFQQSIEYPRIVSDNGIKLKQYYCEDEDTF